MAVTDDVQSIFAIDRGGLNKALLDELESMPNIKFFFNHKLTGADFKKNKAWFTISRGKTSTSGTRDEEIEIDFDFLIGADGAHSAARYHLMKYTRMDYQQEYIDTLWCEFHIEARKVRLGEDPESRFHISPHHLHIWPGKDFMFIAIPSFVSPAPPFPTSLIAPGRFLHLHTVHALLALLHPRSRSLLPPHLLRHPLPRRNNPNCRPGTYQVLHIQPSPTSNQHKMQPLSLLLFSRDPWRCRTRHGPLLRPRDECRLRGRPCPVLSP